MRNGIRASAVIAVTTLFACVGNAAAEPLTLPAWDKLFSPKGELRVRAGDSVPVFVGERFSAGRAVERTVLARSGSASIADRNRAVAGRVAPAFDLGNVYALNESSTDGDQHLYIASEHTFNHATNSVIEYNLYRAPHRLRFVGAGARVLGHDVSGDLRVKVLIRDGEPRGLAVQRRTGGKWRRIMRARFGASGCAGNRERVLVCAKALTSGGPVASPRTGRDLNGTSVPLPRASSMLEIGLNLNALVNANASVASFAVRTERDIVLGQLSPQANQSEGGGS